MLKLQPETWFSFLPGEWAVFFISMLPVSELRGAIPLGIEVYNIHPVFNAIIAVVGNIIPIIFILLLLPKLHEWLLHQKFVGTLLQKKLKKTEEKFKGKYSKYGAVALILFVATPLPFTGAWTGSLAAFIFDIEFKKSFPLILIGVCVAAVIVSLVTLGVGSGVRAVL
jgi:uncharacterized membrane protein